MDDRRQSRKPRRLTPRRQGGSALILSLIFLMVMTLIGVSAMKGTTLQETMASNTRQRNLAFQAAEAALRNGETLLRQTTLPAFNDTQCRLSAPMTNSWISFDWSNCDVNSTLSLVAPARYAIEDLGNVSRTPGAGESVRFGALPQDHFYRVTGRGLGETATSVVILQTTYRR